MRLDHIAYRVDNRYKTASFFCEALGYALGTEFKIEFDDGSKADCIALIPPEVRHPQTDMWTYHVLMGVQYTSNAIHAEYHAPPEVFVSDGPLGSIVGDWVNDRDSVGGIHHIAYQCDDIDETMKEWKEKGYAEFLSDKPLECPGLKQVFTQPSKLTGEL